MYSYSLLRSYRKKVTMRLSLPLLTATLLLFILLTCNVGHTASLNVNRKHIIKHIQPERSVLRVVASKKVC